MKILKLFKEKPIAIIWVLYMILTCTNAIKYAYEGLTLNMMMELTILVCLILVTIKYNMFD